MGYQILTLESFPRTIEAAPRLDAIHNLSAEAWSFAPHAATSLFQSTLWYDPHWYPTSKHPSGDHSGMVSSEASAVRTVCTRHLQAFSNDTFNVSLPILPAYDTWTHGKAHSGPYDSIQLAEPLWSRSNSALTNMTEFTTVWIPATRDTGSTTTGLIVLGPLSSFNTTQRHGVTCSVDARWNKAQHVSAELSLSGFGRDTFSISTIRGGEQDNIITKALPIDDGSWTHISAEKSWLEALTPQVPLRSKDSMKTTSRTTTALANLIAASGVNWNKTKISSKAAESDIMNIETVVSTAVADAVSRVGLARQYRSPKYYASFGTECTHLSAELPQIFCPGPPLPSNYTPLTFHGYQTGKPTHLRQEVEG